MHVYNFNCLHGYYFWPPSISYWTLFKSDFHWSVSCICCRFSSNWPFFMPEKDAFYWFYINYHFFTPFFWNDEKQNITTCNLQIHMILTAQLLKYIGIFWWNGKLNKYIYLLKKWQLLYIYFLTNCPMYDND